MNLREWALPVYTILMQLSVGSLIVLWVIRTYFQSKYGQEEVERMMRNPIAALMITILAAMVGSFFHLSRPILSFLAIINLGKSWLSREIVFTVLMFATIAVLWFLQANVDHQKVLKTVLGWAAVLFGLSATYCMTQLYLLPTQASWDTSFTVLSFLSSVMILGAAASITMLAVDLQYTHIQNPEKLGLRPLMIMRSLPVYGGAFLLITLAILAQYHSLIETLQAGSVTAMASLRLYLGLYWPLLVFRLLALVAGAGWMGIAILRTLRSKLDLTHFTFHSYMACLLLLVGEILGRFLFYATHIRLGI
jgi:anaerobic dimethyl sulfoxide reductase subunit C (anchor subunit)